MSNNRNGNRAKAWENFKGMAELALVARGCDPSEAENVADSLDMSFDELFDTVPRCQWARHIARDADEYMAEKNKH